MVGELIAERYELQELVGTGGMSSVYRAHDRLLERDVALKVLHEEYGTDDDYVERFRREARAVAQLSHPNIVTVIDRGEQDGRQFIVFEYVDGENAKARLKREGPMPERDAIDLGLQIAAALSFAHTQGLVHRDVKPQNVLLGDDAQAKVTDFGIARSVDIDGLTQSGTVMGTSDYIAPEQARGERVDAQTDQYALGAVLYELLTGEVPFPGENFVAVAMRHINEPAPSVQAHRPDASPRLDAAIRRAMAKDAHDRFPSMGAFADELRGCRDELEGEGEEAQTLVVAPRKPSRRERRRDRPPADRPSVWPLITLLAGLAVLAGILAAVFTFTNSSEKLKSLVGASTGARSKPVRLTGVSAYDPPPGDGQEHNADVGRATDGNPLTAWSTEHYNDFTQTKPGVGLVLAAPRPRKLSKLTIRTDTPGFTAEIKAGSSSTGPFNTTVSSSQRVGSRTSFSLHGGSNRYYVVWITDLGSASGVADVNEVTALSG